MWIRLLSLAIWIAAGALTVMLWAGSFLTVILTGCWDSDRRLAHWWAVWWSRNVVRLNPFWKLTVRRLARLDPRRAYVLVANHQSFADVALLPFVGVPYKCLSKDSLFRIPFFGWSLRLHRHIRVKRDSLRSIAQAMAEARQWIGRGMSAAFFAEGTRSRTGTLAPFKAGAFKLAIQTGAPVVPIAIAGTRDALPKGSWLFRHRVDGVITILPPIETTSYTVAEADALKQRVFHAIEHALDPQPRGASAPETAAAFDESAPVDEDAGLVSSSV